MLLSMTGYGDARTERTGLTCTVEIRAVNNRYLKFTMKTPERFVGLEPEIERKVRESIRRGTVYVSVRIQSELPAYAGKINRRVIDDYIADLQAAGLYDRSLIPAILGLPGVVEETESRVDLDSIMPVVRLTLHSAIEKLQRMRIDEGNAMRRELIDLHAAMTRIVTLIEQRAPEVVVSYRNRLMEKVQSLLNDFGAALSPADIVREVSIFSERCDVSEELVRLKSHLAQLRETLDAAESEGRKLDFLVQEMNREANTIGAKSNDAAVAQAVVELKGCIERAREMIQNVE